MRLRCAIASLPLFALPVAAQQSDSPLPILDVHLYVSATSAFRRPAPSFCSGEAGKLISVLNPKNKDAHTLRHRLRESIEHVTSADFLSPKQKRDILYNNAAKFLRFDLRTLTGQ